MAEPRNIQFYVPTQTAYEARRGGNGHLDMVNISPDGQIGFEDCNMDDLHYEMARHPGPVTHVKPPFPELAPHVTGLNYRRAYDPNSYASISYLKGIDFDLKELGRRKDLQDNLSHLLHPAVTEALVTGNELDVALEIPYKTVERWNKIYQAAVDTTKLLLARDI